MQDTLPDKKLQDLVDKFNTELDTLAVDYMQNIPQVGGESPAGPQSFPERPPQAPPGPVSGGGESEQPEEEPEKPEEPEEPYRSPFGGRFKPLQGQDPGVQKQMPWLKHGMSGFLDKLWYGSYDNPRYQNAYGQKKPQTKREHFDYFLAAADDGIELVDEAFSPLLNENMADSAKQWLAKFVDDVKNLVKKYISSAIKSGPGGSDGGSKQSDEPSPNEPTMDQDTLDAYARDAAGKLMVNNGNARSLSVDDLVPLIDVPPGAGIDREEFAVMVKAAIDDIRPSTHNQAPEMPTEPDLAEEEPESSRVVPPTKLDRKMLTKAGKQFRTIGGEDRSKLALAHLVANDVDILDYDAVKSYLGEQFPKGTEGPGYTGDGSVAYSFLAKAGKKNAEEQEAALAELFGYDKSKHGHSHFVLPRPARAGTATRVSAGDKGTPRSADDISSGPSKETKGKSSKKKSSEPNYRDAAKPDMAAAAAAAAAADDEIDDSTLDDLMGLVDLGQEKRESWYANHKIIEQIVSELSPEEKKEFLVRQLANGNTSYAEYLNFKKTRNFRWA